MTRRPMLSPCLLAALTLVGTFTVADGQTDSPAPPTSESVAAPCLDAALVERLRALRPDEAMAYFVLAEDIAAQEPHAEGRRLARGLFTLAYELDRVSPSPLGLGPSVCLALAQLADSVGESQWLLQVGRAMDKSRAPLMIPGVVGTAPDGDDGARLLLAQAIGFGRDDEGKSTRTIITRPEVKPLVVSAMTALGSAARVLDPGEGRPHCPGCAGRRFNRAAGDGVASLQPCPVCLGNPGLRLSADQFMAALRVEAALVRTEHQFWSAQVLADGGSPIREPDPTELARAYGVDPSRPYWLPSGAPGSAGEWARSPNRVEPALPGQ